MLESVTEKLPAFAKDIRLNFSKVLDTAQNDGLTTDQIHGSALAVAYYLKNKDLIEALENLITEKTIHEAAKLATSLMAMTNVYYRFIHLSEQPELSQIPAGLRMQGMLNPGIDKVTFEAMSLAVSILNGCGACITAHCNQLKQAGLSAQALTRIGRISAVLNAVD